jgi:hypothetical protein
MMSFLVTLIGWRSVSVKASCPTQCDRRWRHQIQTDPCSVTEYGVSRSVWSPGWSSLWSTEKKHLCTFLRVNVIEQYGQQSNNSLNVYHLHGVYWHHASVCFVVSMFTILAYCTFSGENVQKKTSNSVQSKDILTHAQDHGKTPSPASQHICCSSLQQKEDLMGVSA